jgi:hypothetical protein
MSGVFTPQDDDEAPSFFTPKQKQIHDDRVSGWKKLHKVFTDIIESLPEPKEGEK